MDSIADEANGNDARLGVLFAVIKGEQRGFEREVRGLLEGEPTLTNVALVLGWIEGDAHGSDCTHK